MSPTVIFHLWYIILYSTDLSFHTSLFYHSFNAYIQSGPIFFNLRLCFSDLWTKFFFNFTSQLLNFIIWRQMSRIDFNCMYMKVVMIEGFYQSISFPAILSSSDWYGSKQRILSDCVTYTWMISNPAKPY